MQAATFNAQSDTPLPTMRRAVCPSCGEVSVFIYQGTQEWPLRVAESLGIPQYMPLWNCDHCHSTISDSRLKEAG